MYVLGVHLLLHAYVETRGKPRYCPLSVCNLIIYLFLFEKRSLTNLNSSAALSGQPVTQIYLFPPHPAVIQSHITKPGLYASAGSKLGSSFSPPHPAPIHLLSPYLDSLEYEWLLWNTMLRSWLETVKNSHGPTSPSWCVIDLPLSLPLLKSA